MSTGRGKIAVEDAKEETRIQQQVMPTRLETPRLSRLEGLLGGQVRRYRGEQCLWEMLQIQQGVLEGFTLKL